MSVSLAVNVSDEEMVEITAVARMLLRDYTNNNILLDDVQFKDTDIRTALRLAVSDYNSMAPVTNLSWKDIPEALLMLGICRWLMLSESFLQVRNQVSVQTDGLGVVGIDDKNQNYVAMSQQLASEFMQRARDLKTSRNLESAYGSLSSGYNYVSKFHN